MNDLRAQLVLTADAKGLITGVNQARRAMDGLGRQGREAGAGATTAGAGLTRLSGSATALGAAMSSATPQLASAATAASWSGVAAGASATAIGQLGSAAAAAQVPIAATGRSMLALAAATEQSGAVAARARRGFDMVGPGVVDLGNASERSARGVSALAAGMRSLLPLLGAAAVIGGARSAVETVSAYEQLQLRMEFLAGSASAAAAEMAWAEETARRMGAGVRDVTDATARLIPIERAGMLTREQRRQITSGMIDAAKALGAESAQLGQVYFGLSQALASPIVRAEELNQVVEPLPGLLQAMDRAIRDMSDGATTSFRQLVNDGEATSDLFARVLVAALGDYAGASERAAESIAGAFQELSTEWERLERSILDSSLVQDGIRIVARIVGGAADLAEGAPARNPLEDQISALRDRVAEAENAAARAEARGDAGGADLQRLLAEADRSRLRQMEALAAPGRNVDAVLQSAIESAEVDAAAAAASDAERERADRALAARKSLLREIDDDAHPTRERVGELRTRIEALRAAQREGIQAGVDYADTIAAIEAEIAKLEAGPKRATRRVRDVVADLTRDLDLARMSARDRSIGQAVDRLAPGAGAAQVAEVERLAGALYDEAEAARAAADAWKTHEAARKAADREAARSAEMRERAGSAAIDGIAAELARLEPTYARDVAALDAWREETSATLAAAGFAHEEYAGHLETIYRGRLAAAQDADLQRRTDWQAGATRAFRAVGEDAEDMASGVEGAITRGFASAEDAIAEFATTGKANFSGLVDGIIADLARLTVRRGITGPLASVLDGLDLGALFGGGGTALGNSGFAVASTPSAVPGGGFLNPSVLHDGGVVGAAGGARRRVPMEIFAGAARYHGGGQILRPGEVPIIAEEGERMLTADGSAQTGALIEAQMALVRSLAAGRAGAGRVEVHLHGAPEGTQVRETDTPDGGLRLDVMLGQMERRIESGIAQRMREGRSPANRALEGRYGLNPAAGLPR